MEKDLFIKGLSTLLFSWESDRPPEAICAANEFINYFEKVNGITLSNRFKEVECYNYGYELEENIMNTLDEIKNLP